MGDTESTKKRFYEEVEKLIAKKAPNNQLFNRDAYYLLLANVKASKDKKTNKKPEDYRRLLRYDTVEIGNVQKLVVPIKNERDPIIYYTYIEEVFDIIHESHLSIGHGGRNRMMAELKSKYKNITIELINTYLNLCEPCQKKMSIPKKGLVVKPIKSNEFNSRCQVDLIDMQSQADGDYKFIMVYQDHLTKFVQMRALKTKTAEEVAYHLLEVFTIFGAPCILHSDNGREFANKVIVELCLMWDEPKIVHGKPRHSQSQGSVERANQDIEKMLATWLETNKTTKWSEGIKFIQFMKNKAHHSGISRSPYEAMFGCKAKVGLKTFLPALETMSDITSEEDLEAMVKNQNGQASEDIDTNLEGSINNDIYTEITTQQATIESGPSDREESIPTNQLNENDDGNNVEKDKNEENIYEPNETEKNSESDNEQIFNENTAVQAINVCSRKIEEARIGARQSLEKQAEKMIKASNAKFTAVEIGQCVRIKVPDVDRAKADGRNIIAVVISIENENLYKLGTKYGILSQLYSRNEFGVCKERFITIEEVPETDITLRECARKDSNLGGQGFQHCNCTSECNSNRCKCKKTQVLCNSKCHKSRTCRNK